MNKIKLLSKHLYLVLLLLTFYCSSFAADDNFIGSYTHDEIEQRLDALNADVDLRLTPEVKKYLHQYLVSYRQGSEILIGRSLLYFPDIEGKLQEKSLPSEIKFLSIIESSLKPAASSRVGATGLWQFMKGTARMYGLKIDKHVDERCDVDKSTEAALTYLSDLNERFGDWTLALAAYNCGPGNVRKAMRRSGGHDYWTIRNYLPRETRNYVPKFIAMTYLMNYYVDHDLAPNYPAALDVETRKLLITKSTSFSKISEITGLDIETLKYYNPSYLGNYIPKTMHGKVLELPTDAVHALVTEEHAIGELILDPDIDIDIEEELLIELQIARERELIEIASLPKKAKKLESFQLIYSGNNRSVIDNEQLSVQDNKIVKDRSRRRVINKKEQREENRKQYAAKVKAAYAID